MELMTTKERSEILYSTDFEIFLFIFVGISEVKSVGTT